MQAILISTLRRGGHVSARESNPELTLYYSTSSASWCRRAYMDNLVSKFNSGDRFKLHYLRLYCISGNKHLHSLWPGLEVILLHLSLNFRKYRVVQNGPTYFSVKMLTTTGSKCREFGVGVYLWETVKIFKWNRTTPFLDRRTCKI